MVSRMRGVSVTGLARREKRQRETTAATPEQAAQILKADAEKRAQECVKAFPEFLKQYGCNAVIVGQFSGNKIETQLQFIAQ